MNVKTKNAVFHMLARQIIIGNKTVERREINVAYVGRTISVSPVHAEKIK